MVRIFSILTIFKGNGLLQLFPSAIKIPLRDFSLPPFLYSCPVCKVRTTNTENLPDIVRMAGTFTADISNLNLLAGKSIFQRNLLDFINVPKLSSLHSYWSLPSVAVAGHKSPASVHPPCHRYLPGHGGGPVREFLTPAVGVPLALQQSLCPGRGHPSFRGWECWLLIAHCYFFLQRIVLCLVGASYLSREVIFLPMSHSLEE